MTTILRYVKTITMLILFVSTSFFAAGQGTGQTITINSADGTGCTGGTVSITFTTVNGNGTADKYRTVEQAQNSGYLPTTFTPVFTAQAGGAVYTGTSFQISSSTFQFATGSGGPTSTTTGITYQIAIPTGLPSGTYYLTLTSINPTYSPSVSTATQVVVTSVPTTSIAYAGSPYCATGTANVTVNPSGTTGTFSAPAGLSINTSTGAVDLAASTPGTYTVTFNYTSGTCVVGLQSTASITINPLPTITGTTSVCVGSTTQLTGSGTPKAITAWGSSNTLVATVDNTGLVTGVAAGTAIISYTNSNGCTSTTTVTVNALPTAAITNNTGSTVLTCSRTSISVTATGGVSYSWSGTLGNAATASITQPGTYTVTVTDANGCSSQAGITITQNITAPGASISAGTMTLTCTTPSTTLTASGNGTFLWSTTATSAAITVTAGGTYTVTVTGANGCTSVAAITIATDQTPPSVSITSSPNTSVLTCTNPSITLTASGNGTFRWSTGVTTAAITVSTPGTYSVTVTGTNGCTSDAAVTITEDKTAPGASITNNTGTTVLTCTTTAISVTAVGNGTFAWSGGLGNNANATITAAGTYTVTITGANGCQSQAAITITSNTGGTAPTLTSSDADNTICPGTSVTFTATAGGTNYQFFLNGSSVQNGASNTYTNASLANNDAVYVTETFSNGCTANSNTIVTTVNSVGTIVLTSASTTNNQSTCRGTAISSITYSVGGSSTGASVSGLPTGVTYSFSGGVLTISGTPTVAGTFNYTVTTSGSPCVNPTATGSITVAAPLTVSSSASGTNNVTTCVNVAMAPITITGVNGSYTLSTSLPTGVNANLSGSTLTLSGTPSVVGNYSFTITTPGACSAQTLTINLTVAQCSVIAGIGAINPTCPGGSNGAINITIQSGGLAPYQVSIDAGQTYIPYTVTPGVNTFSNLPAGIYPVYVKSANNAVDFIGFVTLMAPPAITATVSAGTINCNNGTATLSVSNIAGGNGAPYLVSVDGGAYTSTTTFTVGAGNHTVSVKDSKGCTQTVGSVNVANPTPITATVSAGTVLCNNGTTTLSVTNIAGGAGSYQVSVNGGTFTTTTSFTVASGTYNVVVKDQNGCTYTVGSAIIANPSAVTLAAPRIQPVTVFGGSNGSITILASGGTPNYTYTLTRPGGATTTASGSTASVTFSNLTAGTYTITVTDANGCGNISRTAVVEQPAQSTLPVKFSSVAAANVNCTVKVDWSVAEEINVDHYDVEISANGASFKSAASVHQLNNNGNYAASFSIPSDMKGALLFVRVKEYDVDGKTTTSDIRTVKGNCDGTSNLVIFGYPNPVISGNFITIAAKEGIFNGNYKLELLDNNGKLYQVKEVQLNNVVSVPFEFRTSLGSGKYFIRVTNLEGNVGTVQFIKLGAK